MPQQNDSPTLVHTALQAEPSHPQLRKLSRVVTADVINNIRYSLLSVAAEDPNDSVSDGRLDQSFRRVLESQSPMTRLRFQERARGVLASQALRTAQLGRYSEDDPAEYRLIGSDHLAVRVEPFAIEMADFEEIAANIAKWFSVPGTPDEVDELPDEKPKPHITIDKDKVEGLKFKKLRLFIRKVRCIDGTNEVGDDHIHIGGNATTPFGDTNLVDDIHISDDFNDGVVLDFGWSKKFAGWDLATDPVGFPYLYYAVICMGEKDDNTFYQFLVDLWKEVEQKVVEAIGTAVGAAIGAAIGSAFSFLGTIIGAIAGGIIGWLIDLFDDVDEVLGVKVVHMDLGWYTKSYYDWAKLTSAEGIPMLLDYHGHGSHYRVKFSWKVFTE